MNPYQLENFAHGRSIEQKQYKREDSFDDSDDDVIDPADLNGDGEVTTEEGITSATLDTLEYLGEIGQIDYEEYFDLYGDFYTKVDDLATESAQELIEYNLEKYPEISQLALEAAVGAGDRLQEAMNNSYYASLDNLLPEWREEIIGSASDGLKQVIEISEQVVNEVYPVLAEESVELYNLGATQVASMLQGEVPEDVALAIEKYAAETAQVFGISGDSAGGASSASFANMLGLTSLDLVNQGLAQLTTLANTAASAQNLGAQAIEIAGASITQSANLENITKGLLAGQIDYGSLYTTGLGQITGQATVNPNNPFTTASTVATSSTAIAMSNAQAESAITTSAMNLQSEIYAADVSAQSQADTNSTNSQNAILGFVSSLIP